MHQGACPTRQNMKSPPKNEKKIQSISPINVHNEFMRMRCLQMYRPHAYKVEFKSIVYKQWGHMSQSRKRVGISTLAQKLIFLIANK